MDPVEKRQYNTEQRRQMADEGKALPDGSFPIADKTDLGNALQSIGRAKNRSLVLAHIRRRAKDLGAEDMLPEWAMAKAVSTPLSVALGVLLADTYSVYHEAHGFHWNVKGADFSQYHDLFAEITDDLYDSIDPIAENMLKINADAPFRMSELAAMRTVPESQPASDPQSMASALLTQIDGLLNTLKRTFDTAVSQDEQGVADFLAGRIDATQKWAWQLRASVGMQKAVRLSLADEMALESLRPFVDANTDQWGLLVQETLKAGGVKNLSGYAKDLLVKAAAAAAAPPPPPDGPNGAARRAANARWAAKGKQSFGSRSEAGRYAANVRWGGRGSSGGTSQAAGPRAGAGGGDSTVAIMADQVDADFEDAWRSMSAKQRRDYNRRLIATEATAARSAAVAAAGRQGELRVAARERGGITEHGDTMRPTPDGKGLIITDRPQTSAGYRSRRAAQVQVGHQVVLPSSVLTAKRYTDSEEPKWDSGAQTGFVSNISRKGETLTFTVQPMDRKGWLADPPTFTVSQFDVVQSFGPSLDA